MDCAGVVLTGGTSRRLGFDKAAIELDGETLASRAARVLATVCSTVIEVGPGRTGLPAVSEEPAGSGPLAALVAGVDALGADRVVLMACDLPRVGPAVLRLLAEWDGAPTVVPEVDGRLQLVCARYGADALAAAPSLLATGERSLHALASAVAADVLTESAWGSIADADTFADVDTLDDLTRLGLRAPG